MSPLVKKTLLHFAKLAGLGIAFVVIVGLATVLNGINIATLPVTYQAIAAALIPLIVVAVNNAKQEISAELAAEATQNALVAANAKVDKLTAVAKALGAQPKDIA